MMLIFSSFNFNFTISVTAMYVTKKYRTVSNGTVIVKQQGVRVNGGHNEVKYEANAKDLNEHCRNWIRAGLKGLSKRKEQGGV
jgi:hypothetical protein